MAARWKLSLVLLQTFGRPDVVTLMRTPAVGVVFATSCMLNQYPCA